MKKQVDQSHYNFRKYVHQKRWLSIWHQLDEVLALEPSTLLEVGPGPGLFKVLATHFGISIETLDIDPGLKPDHVASAKELPFNDKSYDCVCAFQMLEHLPYEQSLKAFAEMTRVAKDHVVISLPDAKTLWTYSIYIPKAGQKTIHVPRPRLRALPHVFNGEHYWEINKKGFPLQKIIDDFNRHAKMINTYRVEGSRHRFFIFKNKQ